MSTSLIPPSDKRPDIPRPSIPDITTTSGWITVIRESKDELLGYLLTGIIVGGSGVLVLSGAVSAAVFVALIIAACVVWVISLRAAMRTKDMYNSEREEAWRLREQELLTLHEAERGSWKRDSEAWQKENEKTQEALRQATEGRK